jgi:hypothetical protein
MRLPSKSSLGAVLPLVAASLLLAACGGGGSNDSTGGDSASEQAALKFARCMREHGVNVPDPGTGGEISIQIKPGDKAKADAAQKACGHYLRSLARQSASPAQIQRMQDAALKYARCMRSHGVDFPDPQFKSGGMMQFGGPGLNPNDPSFKAADKACRGLMPGPKGGGSTKLSGAPKGGGAVIGVPK